MRRRTLLLLVMLAVLVSCKQTEVGGEPAGVKVVGNATCPVSGKPVAGSPAAPTFHSDFQGHRIGFMCPVCKGTFDKAPTKEKQRLLMKVKAVP